MRFSQLIIRCFGFQMSGTGCMLFARCLVANFVAAAVDIVVIIIVPPLPFVSAIFEIDDISVFWLFFE